MSFHGRKIQFQEDTARQIDLIEAQSALVEAADSIYVIRNMKRLWTFQLAQFSFFIEGTKFCSLAVVFA